MQTRHGTTRPADGGPTITATLADGPLRGKRMEVYVAEGRPPTVIDVPAVDGSTCRYCLADLTQNGSSARYTFLYHVESVVPGVELPDVR